MSHVASLTLVREDADPGQAIFGTENTDTDLTSEDLPNIDTSGIAVLDGKLRIGEWNTYYVKALPPSHVEGALSFFFLTESCHNSLVWWKRLDTLRTMAALGYPAVAIDLPGAEFIHSQTWKDGQDEWTVDPGIVDEDQYPDPGGRADFLEAVHREMRDVLGERVVLVSPSVSGMYSIPLMLRRPPWIAGYVLMSPLETDMCTADKMDAIKVPVVIMAGAQDYSIGKMADTRLSLIGGFDGFSFFVWPGCGRERPIYVHDPHLFHRIIHNFARRIPPPPPRGA